MGTSGGLYRRAVGYHNSPPFGAEQRMAQPEATRADATWHEAVIRALKDNNVRLVVYVPDNVLRPLIEAVHNDEFFTAFVCAREEEAVGIVCGAAMAGLKGIVLM